MKNLDLSDDDIRIEGRKRAASDGHKVEFIEKISHGQKRYEGRCQYCNRFINYYYTQRRGWKYKVGSGTSKWLAGGWQNLTGTITPTNIKCTQNFALQ